MTLLDQMNGRVVRWSRGRGPAATAALDLAPAIHDMSVGNDGSIYVLDSSTRAGATPAVRAFAAGGEPRAVVPVAERTASQLRIGPRGPLVRQYPAEQWMPVLEGTAPLRKVELAVRGRAGRTLADGREVVVLRTANEIRVLLLGPDHVRKSWRVTSGTPLGEVQLAEPAGAKLVVVARVYEDGRDEFVVLVLGDGGAHEQFSLATADWAEAAPLTRFRLVNRSLYRLGSTSAGVHVDRFDLEVTR